MDSSLLINLKELHLNIPMLGSLRTGDPMPKKISSAIEALLRLVNLSSLKLSSLRTNRIDRPGDALATILHQLANHRCVLWPLSKSKFDMLTSNRWQAKLESLSINSINPCNHSMTFFLETQTCIQDLHVSNCKRYRNRDSDLRRLWKSLRAMPHLSLHFDGLNPNPYHYGPNHNGRLPPMRGRIDKQDVPAFLAQAVALVNNTETQTS